MPRNYSGIQIKSVYPEPTLTTQTLTMGKCSTFCFKGIKKMHVGLSKRVPNKSGAASVHADKSITPQTTKNNMVYLEM